MERHNEFFDKVAALVEQARSFVGRTVDLTMCVTYYEVGRMIVEEEQGGKARAEYGRGLVKELSGHLTTKFGKGFSLTNLKQAKKFYLVYSPYVFTSLPAKSTKGQTATDLLQLSQKGQTPSDLFNVTWSHYLILMRIDNPDERRFYEIEAAKEQWSVKYLSRQAGSSLYERLALSRDKEAVMRLAKEGQTVSKPQDILKTRFRWIF
jgi:hypothetical protein